MQQTIFSFLACSIESNSMSTLKYVITTIASIMSSSTSKIFNALSGLKRLKIVYFVGGTPSRKPPLKLSVRYWYSFHMNRCSVFCVAVNSHKWTKISVIDHFPFPFSFIDAVPLAQTVHKNRQKLLGVREKFVRTSTPGTQLPYKTLVAFKKLFLLSWKHLCHQKITWCQKSL